MIGAQILGTFLSLFPFSFIAFLMSERMLATHQSRVGIGQSGLGFATQGWVNLKDLLGHSVRLGTLVQFGAQLSFLVLIPFFNFDLPNYPLYGGFVFCLVLNLVVQVIRGFSANDLESKNSMVQAKTLGDQKMLQSLVGSALALVCAYSLFSAAGSWSITEVITKQSESILNWGVFWSPIHFLFFILFQISGMLLFNEHPFTPILIDESRDYNLLHSPWVSSARFYVWSLLGATLFFGAESAPIAIGSFLSFLLLQLKGALIFFVFRVAALYFPQHSQREMLKLCFLFLIPTALALLVAVLMLNGAVNV